MNHLAFEIFDAWDGSLQRSRVVIVACAHEHEAAAESLLFGLICSDLERPALILRRIVGFVDMVVEEYLLVDAGNPSAFSKIFDYKIAFRYGTLLRPWTPREAKGIQIGIGADTWILE
jgi:hypothetical protein